MYKCFKDFKIGNKTFVSKDDYVDIHGTTVENITTNAKYLNFSNIDELKSNLEFISDNMDKPKEHPFNRITKEMFETYLKKNRDYGNSFDISLNKWGLSVAAIRLGDKLNRFESYVKNGVFAVDDEGVHDTLKDLATYAIMTVMYLNGQSKPANEPYSIC